MWISCNWLSRHVDLSGVDLSGADLRGCRVVGTHLARCRLAGTKLEGIAGDDLGALRLVAAIWAGGPLPASGVPTLLAHADFSGAVLAVDLYRRTPGFAIEDPGEWMRGLSDPQATEDIQAAADWLRRDPVTACPRTGVTGFCMGDGGILCLFFVGTRGSSWRSAS